MKKNTYKAILIFLLTSFCVSSQEKIVQPTVPSGAIKVQYYEGKDLLSVYLLPDVIAELGVEEKKGSLTKSLDSNAQSIKVVGNTHYFKVSDKSLLSGGKVATKASKAGNFSPVYSRTGGTDSLLYPMGFIIEYKPTAKSSEISALETKYNLRNGKKLPIATLNQVVYPAEPGQATLDLSQTIRTESIVEATYPEWHEEMFRR
jgi:hypothetical protein